MARPKKKSASRAKKSASLGKKVPKSKKVAKSKLVAKKKVAKSRTPAPRAESKYIPHPPVPSATLEADVAHMPGHRKLDRNQGVLAEAGKVPPAADNNFTQNDKVNRETAQKRITGFVKSAGQRRRRALQD